MSHRHRRRPLSYKPRDPWEGQEKPNQGEVDMLLGLFAIACLVACLCLLVSQFPGF